ncbi:sarcosine oxidase subunit delta [Kiloniella sp. b19]|uniref:sarcosine oxidase subunit delta n=1 Tax=Kiloniella sp. GXU_MW_B19 TaxID=3141326 RepID=UPI0031E26925
MKINCPCCGPRSSGEFSYEGDALRTRPADDNQDRENWASYVYGRENPRGWHREYWQHTGGCRSILEVERNTVTHEIRSVRLVGPWADQQGKGETA